MRLSHLVALLATSCSATGGQTDPLRERRIVLRFGSAVEVATIVREVLPPSVLLRRDEGRRVCVRRYCDCTADPTDNSVTMRGSVEALAEFAALVARWDALCHDAP